MKEFLEKFKEIKNIIEKNQNIILTAHVNPDGDAVGSGLGLFLTLKENYRNKDIRFVLQDDIPYTTKFLNYDIPMIVLTVDANPPEYFFDLVKKSGHILAIAPYKKASQIVANFNNYLDSFFSETISVHGVLVELFGFGVLLTGKSGIGKSETALELIHRGHRLIADDMVKFYRDTQGDVVGKSAELPFFMEIRGLGVIDIKTLYGLSAVRLSKRLDMIIELQAVDNSDYMSAPSTHVYEDVLGKPIKKRILEISSGRNAAAMVEVMVMDYMSGLLGQK